MNWTEDDIELIAESLQINIVDGEAKTILEIVSSKMESANTAEIINVIKEFTYGTAV